MIRILTGILLLTVLFSSCGDNPKDTKNVGLLSKLNANEDKGIKEIISFYGGRCEYGREKIASVGEPNALNFWIKFSQSSDIDSLASIAELPGSNIAYLFYKNLTKEENIYQNIQSELIFSDGREMKFTYSRPQLESVKNKMQLVNKIVSLIKTKRLTDLKTYLNPDTALFNFDKEKAILDLEKAESELGNVKEFIPYGFKFSKAPDGTDVLHISGIITRDEKSNYFSVYLDPNSTKEEIYTINYKL